MTNGKLVTVAEMQELEAAADSQGHSYALMMEIAGRAVAEVVASSQPSVPSSRNVLILVGPGNNGGDGLVCAQHVATQTASQQSPARLVPRIYLWKRERAPANDTQNHLATCAALGLEIAHIDDDPELRQLQVWLREADLVVDALLGTGNRRPIEGTLAQILKTLSTERARREVPLIAVDCPSGLYCDSGEVDPETVAADQTVTFAYAKWGHFIFPGPNVTGDLHVANIGIPPSLAAHIQTFTITPEWLRTIAPHRDSNSHKGTFGKAMIAAGCFNYAGAAFLACAAAGRAGAGLVTGAVPAVIWPAVASKLAEPTWLPFGMDSPKSRTHLQKEDLHTLIQRASGYTSLLVGCGLGQTDETQAFIAGLCAQADLLPPTVIDADGLNCLVNVKNWAEELPASTIITPHAAEMSRLTGLPLDEVRNRRWQIAREKAAEWDMVVLLKGPYTVIAAPDGRLAVLSVATPALATAGTGDVLAGTIVGLLAQGMSSFEAACLGAWVHGHAGLRCAAEIGQAGVIASDLLARLPLVLNSLRSAS